MYVSQNTSTPSKRNHDWSAASDGSDLLAIDASDAKLLPGVPLHIGVAAPANVSYTLLATRRPPGGAATVRLLPGVPQRTALGDKSEARSRFGHASR